MTATRIAYQQTLPNSRIYAIREIARRAGVSGEFFRSWQCTIEGSWTVIRLGPEGSKKIRFPNASLEGQDNSPRIRRQAARALWAYAPDRHLSQWVPDFVVPFVATKNEQRLPVFLRPDTDSVDFRFDLSTAALLTLSRREENEPTQRDAHGRFPAASSVAMEFDFLHRPIVDEYGFAMEQALRCLIPTWTPLRRELRVKLSHDIDDVGIPFVLRATIGHALSRRNPSALARDFLSVMSRQNPAYLSVVKRLALLTSEHRLDSAIYWKASAAGPFDTGYDPRHPKIQKVIAWLSKRGVECGVHPGYGTYDSPGRLQSEVNVLREVLGREQLGGRQHYLRWRPDTWRHWETCGLSYDSTVGFADQLGFRAGTCVPYRPWLFSEDREANLIEVPLIAMDCTPIFYMGLSVQESFDKIVACIERCRLVGGVFTLLWHNTSLMDPRYGNLYNRLLALLSGAKRFDWVEATADRTYATT